MRRNIKIMLTARGEEEADAADLDTLKQQIAEDAAAADGEERRRRRGRRWAIEIEDADVCERGVSLVRTHRRVYESAIVAAARERAPAAEERDVLRHTD